MKLYKINELFYSLQGEGRHTGRASFFIRFSGCNRACPFCDTDFTRYELLTIREITACIPVLIGDKRAQASSYWGIVLTGGEPSLQLDSAFLDALKEEFGKARAIQIETNGADLKKLLEIASGKVNLTVSPKTTKDARAVLRVYSGAGLKGRYPLHDFSGDEIKIVPAALDDDTRDEILLDYAREIPFDVPLYIQPCDYGDSGRNAEENKRCIAYIKENPRWRLSTQTQKTLKIR